MSGNTVIAYLRVSTLGQDTGLDIQRDKILGWARFEGLELKPELVFEDRLSGASDDRPGLKAALRAALQTEDAVLVVYKLDRLGRSAVDVQEALEVLLDARVRVVALADGVDSASGMGATLLKLFVSVLSTFAELERETIRTRLLDGRRRADAENRRYASEPRYGRVVGADGQLQPAHEEQAAIALIRQRHAEGISVRSTIAELKALGLKPRRASTWSTSVVQRIRKGREQPKKTKKRGRVERARAELLGTP